METGTRRECLFYLADSHWLIFRRWVAGFTVILLLTLFATTSPVQAAGQVNPTIKNTGYWFPYGWVLNDITNAYGSAIEACVGVGRAMQTNNPWLNSVFVGTEPNVSYYASMEMVNCLFQKPGTGEIGPLGSVHPVRRSVCPSNSNPLGGLCTCDAGYKPDPTITSCVPVVACPANSIPSTLHPSGCSCYTGYKVDPLSGTCVPLQECTIPDLPPITDPEVLLFEGSPNRADTARLTPRMQTALTCLKTDAAAGSPSTGSAFRPPAYNQHLIDVWNKWREFRTTGENYNLDCVARREQIRFHFKKHGLLETQAPVPGSLHTKGEAVDVTINLPDANIDALAAQCKLRRPLPVKDKVHFIHQ